LSAAVLIASSAIFFRDLCAPLRIVATDMKLAHCSRTFIAIAILAISVQHSRAYGPDGHHIVGAIADERLANTPAGLCRS
jgi:hypothetical protein